jgi:hypothetical protein
VQSLVGEFNLLHVDCDAWCARVLGDGAQMDFFQEGFFPKNVFIVGARVTDRWAKSFLSANLRINCFFCGYQIRVETVSLLLQSTTTSINYS